MLPPLLACKGAISLTPITIELVDGSFISVVVGFCIAMSVTISPALEGISAWYMHIFPGVDNGFTNSCSAGVRFGAWPINTLSGLHMEALRQYDHLISCMVLNRKDVCSHLGNSLSSKKYCLWISNHTLLLLSTLCICNIVALLAVNMEAPATKTAIIAAISKLFLSHDHRPKKAALLNHHLEST